MYKSSFMLTRLKPLIVLISSIIVVTSCQKELGFGTGIDIGAGTDNYRSNRQASDQTTDNITDTLCFQLGITGGVLMRPIDPRYLEAARKIRSRDRLATTTKIFPGWLCTASRFELPALELLLSSPKVSQLVNRHPDQRKRERLKLLIQ